MHITIFTKMNRALYFVVFFLLLLVTKSSQSDVPSCPSVISDLMPCLSYLRGSDPTTECCAGVKTLYSAAKTKEDRVAACNCVKSALGNISYDPKRLPPLPKQCGVNFDLPAIDKTFDCSKMPMRNGTTA